MDKLNLMFDAKRFAAEFGAARDDSSAARDQPDATVWLQGDMGDGGTGFTWGCGQVKFQGRNHLFRASNISMAQAGAASIYATGQVMRLRKISDFSGTYRTSSAAGMMTNSATCLQNEHGVMIQLVATDAATAARRSVNGVRLKLKHV